MSAIGARGALCAYAVRVNGPKGEAEMARLAAESLSQRRRGGIDDIGRGGVIIF
jgi:hypothetical protein